MHLFKNFIEIMLAEISKIIACPNILESIQRYLGQEYWIYGYSLDQNIAYRVLMGIARNRISHMTGARAN
jgi:hypothetical protein